MPVRIYRVLAYAPSVDGMVANPGLDRGVLCWCVYLLYGEIYKLTICPVYVVYQLARHRHSFGKLLANADSALTSSRFVRLVLLSGAYALFTLPLSIYQFTLQLKVGEGYRPYDWAEFHVGVSTGRSLVDPNAY
jgi:hypothetical protein